VSVICCRPRAGSSMRTAGTPRAGSRRSGEFYTAADTQYFYNTYCANYPTNQCLTQFTNWVAGSYGDHPGRGFSTDMQNGSEATAARYSEDFYWNGSAWATLQSYMLPPGHVISFYAGNWHAPTCSDSSWYFGSEIQDNGVDSATVALDSHVSSPGNGTLPITCTYICGKGGCSWRGYCNGYCCSYSCNGASGYQQSVQIPLCANDSCCNPP
jgi:hypothetical protein